MSYTIALIALESDAKLSAVEIKQALATTWPDLAKVENLQKRDNAVAFRLGKSDVVLALMPEPIPWSDLESACSTSWLWPEASTVLANHASHMMVTVANEMGPVSRAKLLTQLTASVIATCQQAVGVLWPDAPVVVSANMFRDFAVEFLPRGLPLYLWIDFQVSRSATGSTCGFTTGLTAFGHMEFEAADSPETPSQLRDRLFGLAANVLENGAVVEDGHQIGDDHEPIHITYAESCFKRQGKVMRLDYFKPSGRKPKWRIW